MPKRMTATEKWDQQWFRKLPPTMKCFWIYLLDKCNHAGIWSVDFELAGVYIGAPIDDKEVRKLFVGKFKELPGGSKWFVPAFIPFQYNELNPTNRAHLSVISILKHEGIYKGLVSPLLGDKDKDKDIVKDKAKDKDKNPEEKQPEDGFEYFSDWFGYCFKDKRGYPLWPSNLIETKAAELFNKYGWAKLKEKMLWAAEHGWTWGSAVNELEGKGEKSSYVNERDARLHVTEATMEQMQAELREMRSGGKK